MSELPPVLAKLHQRAKAKRRRVVLPEVADPRTKAAAQQLEDLGLADVVWVGDPASHPHFAAVCDHILERRKHKGVDAAAAESLAKQPLYYAASLVALGAADCSVAGAAHTTTDVIRAGIHCVGVARGIRAVSSMFLMVRGEQALSYADCGVLPDPDPDELCSVAMATAHNHELFTDGPARVAFLSFSTNGSADHPHVDKVRAGLTKFQAACPDVVCDGELQFDAAFVPEVAARKAKDSPLQGKANVFVFPDLDAGNIAYKITERLGGFQAFGPLVQGLAKPCLDLSRGCSANDIVNVAALASVMAG